MDNGGAILIRGFPRLRRTHTDADEPHTRPADTDGGGEKEAKIFHIFSPRFERKIRKIIVCRQDEGDVLEVSSAVISLNFS